MLKDVPLYLQSTCELCNYVESIEYDISLTLNNIDYFRVECAKGNCSNGDGFVKAETPKDFKKIYPSDEHISPSEKFPFDENIDKDIILPIHPTIQRALYYEVVEAPQEVSPYVNEEFPLEEVNLELPLQQILYDNGFRSIEDLAKASMDEIESKTKLSKNQIRNIMKKAKNFLVSKFAKTN